MKRVAYFLAITLLIVSALSVPAFAQGGRGHGGGARNQPIYELCTEADCDLLGPHQHDSAWYCNQTGYQSTYEICTVEGCTQFGLHEHDGAYYYCVYRGTGRGGCCWR